MNTFTRIQSIVQTVLNEKVWEESGRGVTISSEGVTVYTPTAGPVTFESGVDVFDAAQAIVVYGDEALPQLIGIMKK